MWKRTKRLLYNKFFIFFSTLQKTLDELKNYQRQQELWINYHKKLRAEQAPLSVLLEQRLHYREFKIRQKLESTFDLNGSKTSSSEVGEANNSSSASSTKPSLSSLKDHQSDVLASEVDDGEEKVMVPISNNIDGPKLFFKINGDSGDNGKSMLDKIVIELDSSLSETENSLRLQRQQQSEASGCPAGGDKNRKKYWKKNNNNNSDKNAEESLLQNHHDHDKSSSQQQPKSGNDSNESSKKSPTSARKSAPKKHHQSISTNDVSDADNTDAREASGSNSGGNSARPILIPVTFVLPPS